MQTGSCDENFVRLSVRPSVKCVDCDKTEERYVLILYHTKCHLAQFFENKNGWWGRPLLPETLTGSPLRAFQRA